MITLNDYLYSGDTVLKILKKYTEDLRQSAARTGNEVDVRHQNFCRRLWNCSSIDFSDGAVAEDPGIL